METFILDINTSLHLEKELEEEGDWTQFIENYSGEIRIFSHDIDDSFLIGKIEFDIIDSDRAMNHGIQFLDVMDQIDSDRNKYGEAVFNQENQIIVRDIEGEVFYPNSIFIFHLIELKEEYRGNRYSADLTKQMINRFTSRCGLFVLMPAPQQFKKASEVVLGETYDLALRRLTDYWMGLGFKPTINDQSVLYLISG